MIFPYWLPVYGDVSYRGDCPKEDVELSTFFNQLRKTYPDIAKRAWHTENEGVKNHDKSRMKGQLVGVSDIVIMPGFCCEMKRLDHTKSTWQKGQVDFLKACQEAGTYVCVALGWEAAMEAVRKCTMEDFE